MKINLLPIGLTLLSFWSFAQNAPQGLALNDKAPDFAAKDQFKNEVRLASLVKNGPVVIMFYRGEWCPYCNKQLSEMQDSLLMLTSKGATVLAITPEKTENITKTLKKTNASYSILFDDGLKIMNSYKVSFQVDTTTITRYKKYGVDLNVVNGDNGANLPIPAVYIIDKNGKIIYRYFDADYRKRPSVKELARHL